MNESVFIIIPCFNEGEVIRQTLLPLLTKDYVIVVVDDGSDLELYPLVSDLPIHYLQHGVNQGQGASLQTGMDYARQCGADIVVHFDADGQHRPEDIATLIAPLLRGEADVVLGSRFLSEEDTRAVPLQRRLILLAARVVNLLFTGMWLTDAHNGLRALNRKALAEIRVHQNRMAHATEILRQIKLKKLRYCERATHVIYTPYSRRKGQTMLGAINIIFDLIEKGLR